MVLVWKYLNPAATSLSINTLVECRKVSVNTIMISVNNTNQNSSLYVTIAIKIDYWEPLSLNFISETLKCSCCDIFLQSFQGLKEEIIFHSHILSSVSISEDKPLLLPSVAETGHLIPSITQ